MDRSWRTPPLQPRQQALVQAGHAQGLGEQHGSGWDTIPDPLADTVLLARRTVLFT
jgi:hypothetical protein